MKRSLLAFASLVVIGLGMLFAYSRDTFYDTRDLLTETWHRTRGWLVELVTAPIQMSADRAGVLALVPRRMLITARAFSARIVRRARPRVENGWRMVSSA